MFKGVDPTRPWPSTGMTTAKWMELPVFPTYIPVLIATQDGVYFKNLLSDEPSEYVIDPYPHVIFWRGEFYLEDGHSRVMRAILRGLSTIQARVLVIEEDSDD